MDRIARRKEGNDWRLLPHHMRANFMCLYDRGPRPWLPAGPCPRGHGGGYDTAALVPAPRGNPGTYTHGQRAGNPCDDVVSVMLNAATYLGAYSTGDPALHPGWQGHGFPGFGITQEFWRTIA